MQGTNIILGYGETLTAPFKLKRNSGDKKYPYLIGEQRLSLGADLKQLAAHHARLPAEVRPRGQAVAKMTLHPTFLAKSYHPNALLAASGLRCVGSRSTYVLPRKQTAAIPSLEPIFTAVLYVAGEDWAFQRLSDMLQSTKTAKVHQDALLRLETIQPFAGHDKDLVRERSRQLARLEVVLHGGAGDADILQAFARYVSTLGGKTELARSLPVSGLTFVPVWLAPERIATLGEFQFVRAIRLMPSLRLGGTDLRSIGAPGASLPTLPALDPTLKVGVFDGGIGHSGLEPWVTETIMSGTESTSAPFLNHGNTVTSTVLFGPIDPAQPEFRRPFANVRHYRCISPALQTPDGVTDVDLYDVLKHIDQVLSSERLDFVNLSLGPRMPIEDDEVHPWTALIDKHLAAGTTFATVAVGNDGEGAWPYCRVQPPADMVNALAVGACDSTGPLWQRAPYSSYGPGRSPGLIKPDGVAFGGVPSAPIVLYNGLTGQLTEAWGTSYSSPYTLHTAIGVKASLTSPLNMLALRALMNHHAARGEEMNMSEVGHGRFPQSAEEVLRCDDNEVRVIYQGTLRAGENMRALIPFPTLALKGTVTLRTTLCFSSHTDPEHAINYTRAGLTVLLRPNRSSTKTMSFFSASKMYTPELEARTGEQKWETTLKHEHDFRASTLNDPVFDITYGAREEGQAVDNSSLTPLSYAMVVTVAVKDTPGIYNNIRQRYQTLQPVEIRQEVRVRADGAGGS